MIFKVCFILIIILILYWYLKNYFYYRNLASKFYVPKLHPIFGNVFLYFGSTQTITRRFIDFMKTGTDRLGIWQGPIFYVHLLDPEDIKTVLTSTNKIEKGRDHFVFKTILNESTFTMSVGPEYKQHKKIMLPWFRISNLVSFFDIFNYHSDNFVKQLATMVGQEFDVAPHVSLASFNVLSEAIIGLNKNYIAKNGKIIADLTDEISALLMERSLKFWLQSDFIYKITGKKKKFDQKLNKLNEIVTYAIDERIKAKRSDQNYTTFIDYVLDAKNDDGTPFSYTNIHNELKTLLYAGHETTNSSLCFILNILGIHKEVQEKLYQEITSVVKDTDYISYEDVMKLEYMDRVMYETWRLYPAASYIAKYATDEIKLGDAIIPKNTDIVIMTIGVHRNPKIYLNPDKYNPDNFLPENVQKRHPYSFIPFSLGNRACFGQKFSYFVQKVTIAKILKNFKIHSNTTEEDFQLMFEITLKKADGFRIILEPRKNC